LAREYVVLVVAVLLSTLWAGAVATGCTYAAWSFALSQATQLRLLLRARGQATIKV
jgi:hypothetical protein